MLKEEFSDAAELLGGFYGGKEERVRGWEGGKDESERESRFELTDLEKLDEHIGVSFDPSVDVSGYLFEGLVAYDSDLGVEKIERRGRGREGSVEVNNLIVSCFSSSPPLVSRKW